MRFISTIHKPLYFPSLSLRHKIRISKQLVLSGAMFVTPPVSHVIFDRVRIFAYRIELTYIWQFKTA